MWDKVKALFNHSETIAWARIQAALGFLALVLTYVDPAIMSPLSFHIFPKTMRLMDDWLTPNISPSASWDILPLRRRILRTSSIVSFACPFLSPVFVVPWRSLSDSFSNWVAHRRWCGLTHSLLPQEWAA